MSTRKSVYIDMREFSPGFCLKDDYIEVTEWTNGEGVDITNVFRGNTSTYQFTYDELEAIQKCVKAIQNV